MKTGIELIDAEFIRQTTEEGYTTGHDDAHDKSELCRAADCYAMEPWQRDQPGVSYTQGGVGNTHPKAWPWSRDSWKPVPKDRKRELVKAGALYKAEIERLQRKVDLIAHEIDLLD